MVRSDKWLIIGQVHGAHGTGGEVRVAILTDFPEERFVPRAFIYVGEKHDRYQIERVRHTPRGALIKLAGINTRTEAEGLKQAYLMIRSEDALPLPPDTYYHHQIEGLAVSTEAGEFIGTVREILSTGSNDVYVVQGELYGEVLLPATKEVVLSIDLEAQRMTVRLLPGLLPDDKDSE